MAPVFRCPWVCAPYFEIGVRFGDAHFAVRPIGEMDVEFAAASEVAAVLGQFLAG